MTDLHLVGGWNTQAIWKICDRQNGFIFPKDRGEHEKYLSCHHLGRGWKVAKKKSCIYSLVFLKMIQKSSNSNSPLRWCPVQPFYQWQFRAALTTRKLCMLKNVHPHKHTPRSDQYILKVACIFFWYWRASKIHPKKTYSCHCMDGIGSPGYKKKDPSSSWVFKWSPPWGCNSRHAFLGLFWCTVGGWRWANSSVDGWPADEDASWGGGGGWNPEI